MINKKVVIFTSYSPSIIPFRGQLISDLQLAGCTVTVIAPQLSTETTHELKELGVTPVCINLSRKSISIIHHLKLASDLSKLFRQLKPDVVFTTFLKPNLIGIFIAFIAAVPCRICMIEGLGYFFTPGVNRRRTFVQIFISEVILLLYRLIFPLCSCVVTLNSDDTILLQARCRLPPGKILQLPGIGISLGDWPSQPPVLNPITFMFAGRFLYEKGILEFLKSASYIKHSHPFTRFILLGDFDSNPGSIAADFLRPFIDSGTVEWFGFAKDLLPFYRQTSVFVLPSYREGLPRTIQEAMACGLPIITTNVPGCRETVIDGYNGFLVESHSTTELISAMSSFIDNPHLISSMGANSTQLASKWFDVSRINEKILERISAA